MSTLPGIEPELTSGAEFSPCRQWRYTLWRFWEPEPARLMAFVGLNPSTADETANDPTVTRCIGYARRWGFDGMFMLNAFAFRATQPRDMKAAADPNGPGNDEALQRISDQCELIVAAWGTHGAYLNRGQQVCRLLNRPLHCLKQTKDGFPGHPLYLRRDAEPVIFWEPTHIADSRKMVQKEAT